MNQAFLEYFRCPELPVHFELDGGAVRQNGPGYFMFGPAAICYGRCDHSVPDAATTQLPDALPSVRMDGQTCFLPFDPDEVATNLRYERYQKKVSSPLWKRLVRSTYYALRPMFPVSVRQHLQRAWLKGWDQKPFPRWPVDRSVDQMFETMMRLALEAGDEKEIPFIWFWPEAKPACAIMTHDVETIVGLNFAPALMDINDLFEIKSSFQIIPDARYAVQPETLSLIRSRGFEVNVHDLKHDGHLYKSRDQFQKNAVKINHFAAEFQSTGFRAGVLYRNQEWYDAFRFSYDMSVPNVGHLDPQPGGCCTVMPYFIGDILEIPVTTIQDYSLFHVLNSYSLDIWKEQIDRIQKHHGLISVIVHPDYLQTEEARNAYKGLLGCLSDLRASTGMWITLPGEVDRWWRQRSKMQLVRDGSRWRIEGAGSERASIAYATLENGSLHYRIE